jgi:hypothetical protein
MDSQTTAITTNLTASKQKIDQLFTRDKITSKDLENFTQPDYNYFSETCTKKLRHLKGQQRDNFLEQIDQVINPTTKSDIWEYNHSTITNAVSSFIQQYGVMPAKNAIAEKTGLSRQTVAKHLATYNRHPDFTAQMEQFKFMAPNLFAGIYKLALNGDVRAAKLYLEMVGATNKQQPSTVVNEQNNYIQINNKILSQENLKQLTNEQFDQIETIITNNVDKKLCLV